MSDQRQLGTYPLLSALVCSFVDAFRALSRSQMFSPSYPLVYHSIRSLARIVWYIRETLGRERERARAIQILYYPRRKRYLKSKHFPRIFASNGTGDFPDLRLKWVMVTNLFLFGYGGRSPLRDTGKLLIDIDDTDITEYCIHLCVDLF